MPITFKDVFEEETYSAFKDVFEEETYSAVANTHGIRSPFVDVLSV
jgi:hypothetical protein